jgi:hypothetical protein
MPSIQHSDPVEILDDSDTITVDTSSEYMHSIDQDDVASMPSSPLLRLPRTPSLLGPSRRQQTRRALSRSSPQLLERESIGDLEARVTQLRDQVKRKRLLAEESRLLAEDAQLREEIWGPE